MRDPRAAGHARSARRRHPGRRVHHADRHRGHRGAARRKHSNRADQRHGDLRQHTGRIRSNSIRRLRAHGAEPLIRHGQHIRHHQRARDHDSGHLRFQHHELLHQRHASADLDRPAGDRPGTHRGAARAARYVVRLLRHGRHGSTHHPSAGSQQRVRLRGHARLRHSRRGSWIHGVRDLQSADRRRIKWPSW